MSAAAAPHPKRKVALLIAIAADALQVVLLPFFAPGFPAVWDDALDIAIGVVMIRLLGWHFAFLPTFLAEIVPGVNLLPTWTAAVWFVTRKGKGTPLKAEVVETPAPELPAETSVPKLP